MTQYNFILTGQIKPAVRMTRRGKFKNPDALEYMASQNALKWQLKKQMLENSWKILPSQKPLAVELSIGVEKVHISDLDNITKAVLDAANKIVYFDDCWIDKVNVWRYKADSPTAELTVWVRE